jgi:transposase
MIAVLEADAPRVACPVQGVVVAAVPWARHDAGHTFAFDAQVAWLATQASKSTVTEMMRIAWRTVGSIISRVNRPGIVETPIPRKGGVMPAPRKYPNELRERSVRSGGRGS